MNQRNRLIVVASMAACMSAGTRIGLAAEAAQVDNSPSVVQRVEDAIVRGAHAAASGIERGVNAARRGMATGADAAARGIDKGATATAHAADTVAGKMGVRPASAPASASGR
jgi:hypothetical protein